MSYYNIISSMRDLISLEICFDKSISLFVISYNILYRYSYNLYPFLKPVLLKRIVYT